MPSKVVPAGSDGEKKMTIQDVMTRAEIEVVSPSKREREENQLRLDTTVSQLKLATAVVGIFGMITAIMCAELAEAYGDAAAGSIQALKAITTASTVLLLMLVGMLYRNRIEAARMRGDLDAADNLYSTGMFGPLLAECVVCALHCPIGVTATFQVSNTGLVLTYTLEDVFSVLVLARVYLLAGVFDDLIGLTSNQARVISKWNKVDFTLGFTFRSMMERDPLSFVLSILLVVTLCLAHALQIAERPVCKEWAHIIDRCGPYDDNYTYYTTALWNIIITMTTVGYGDIYPISHAGRVVATIGCFLGVVLIALLVTAITNIATFEPEELRAFNALYKARGRQDFRVAAVGMIRAAWAYYKHRLRTIYGSDAVLAFPTRTRMRRPTAAGMDRGVQIITLKDGSAIRVPSGYHVLLHQVHSWKRARKAFWNIAREKSELGLLTMELLQSRARMNEIAESLAKHFMLLNAIVPNLKAQLDAMSLRLGVSRLPLPDSVIPDPGLAPGMAGFTGKLIYHPSMAGGASSARVSADDYPLAFVEPPAAVATSADLKYTSALRSLPSMRGSSSVSSNSQRAPASPFPDLCGTITPRELDHEPGTSYDPSASSEDDRSIRSNVAAEEVPGVDSAAAAEGGIE